MGGRDPPCTYKFTGIIMQDENKPEKEVEIETVSVDTAKNSTTAPATDAPADITPDAANDDEQNNAAAELDALKAEFNELNDKYLRSVAELENTRRRAALDAESRARNRAMNVAKEFLPVMDAIVAAQKHAPDDAGIQSMARAMESAFAQIGIVKIDSVGQVLNPQFHNSIQVVPAPADANPAPAPNTIVSEMQAGYMFGDSVLRTAMVVVCK